MTPFLPHCSAPLLFESHLEGFPYGVSGTGFLCSTVGRHYFITAKHCLAAGDHNQLRIPIVLGENQLIPLKNFGETTLPAHEEDTDHGDFVIFSVDASFEVADSENALKPAYIPTSDTLCLLQSKIWLTIRGFPLAAPGTRIDYENTHISTQAVQCDARYIGLTTSKLCHELRFIETCPVSDINGMSGSPVFAKLPSHGTLIYILVGMMIRESRFISIEVVKEGIRRFETIESE